MKVEEVHCVLSPGTAEAPPPPLHLMYVCKGWAKIRTAIFKIHCASLLLHRLHSTAHLCVLVLFKPLTFTPNYITVCQLVQALIVTMILFSESAYV
jgi:hypothetical protein